MAKVNLVAAQPYKGRAVGDKFQTSAKNSRQLIADGVATAPVKAKKAAAKKAPAKKVATKKAAKKAPAKKAKGYNTRALKAR